MKTVCPEHGETCDVSCPSWREQRAKDAETLSQLLERAHRARVSTEFTQTLNLLSPVPAIRDREEDPTLMIWAYALVVNRLLQGEGHG